MTVRGHANRQKTLQKPLSEQLSFLGFEKAPSYFQRVCEHGILQIEQGGCEQRVGHDLVALLLLSRHFGLSQQSQHSSTLHWRHIYIMTLLYCVRLQQNYILNILYSSVQSRLSLSLASQSLTLPFVTTCTRPPRETTERKGRVFGCCCRLSALPRSPAQRS